MEIDFNDEQLEKVKQLESYDISVGDAIDMLFEVRDRVSSIINDIDQDKLEDATPDEEPKAAESEETSNTGKTYDMAIEDVKTHVSWANTFFKF